MVVLMLAFLLGCWFFGSQRLGAEKIALLALSAAALAYGVNDIADFRQRPWRLALFGMVILLTGLVWWTQNRPTEQERLESFADALSRELITAANEVVSRGDRLPYYFTNLERVRVVADNWVVALELESQERETFPEPTVEAWFTSDSIESVLRMPEYPIRSSIFTFHSTGDVLTGVLFTTGYSPSATGYLREQKKLKTVWNMPWFPVDLPPGGQWLRLTGDEVTLRRCSFASLRPTNKTPPRDFDFLMIWKRHHLEPSPTSARHLARLIVAREAEFMQEMPGILQSRHHPVGASIKIGARRDERQEDARALADLEWVLSHLDTIPPDCVYRGYGMDNRFDPGLGLKEQRRLRFGALRIELDDRTVVVEVDDDSDLLLNLSKYLVAKEHLQKHLFVLFLFRRTADYYIAYEQLWTSMRSQLDNGENDRLHFRLFSYNPDDPRGAKAALPVFRQCLTDSLDEAVVLFSE